METNCIPRDDVLNIMSLSRTQMRTSKSSGSPGTKCVLSLLRLLPAVGHGEKKKKRSPAQRKLICIILI